LVNAVGDTLPVRDCWKNGTQHRGALNGKNLKFECWIWWCIY